MIGSADLMQRNVSEMQPDGAVRIHRCLIERAERRLVAGDRSLGRKKRRKKVG